MRFKLYYNNITEKMTINALLDNSINNNKIYLSDDINEHVLFPMPDKYKKEICDILTDNFDSTEIDEQIKTIDEQIHQLHHDKNELINNIRAEQYPEIIKKCKEFRNERAEEFI